MTYNECNPRSVLKRTLEEGMLDGGLRSPTSLPGCGYVGIVLYGTDDPPKAGR